MEATMKEVSKEKHVTSGHADAEEQNFIIHHELGDPLVGSGSLN